jgi:hypothetical protein
MIFSGSPNFWSAIDADMRDAERITEVRGNVWLYAGASLPNLESVTGSMKIGSGTHLPALACIGGNLDIHQTLARPTNLPALTAIHGSLFDMSSETLHVPLLTKVRGRLAVLHDFDHSNIEFGAGEVLALSEYALHYRPGVREMYRAGCRTFHSKAAALLHWEKNMQIDPDNVLDRVQGHVKAVKRRAEIFVEALKNHNP